MVCRIYFVKMIMKTINTYINETLTSKQSDIVVDLILQMFANTKMSSDDIYNMFINVDIDIIKKIEKTIYERDPQGFIAYMANDDDYIKQDNKQHIIEMFSQYIYKKVSNQQ